MSLWDGIINAIFVVTARPSISITKPIMGTGYVNPKWREFAEKIKPMAVKVEERTGIPWRFSMIQAGHESRHGESLLAVEARNLFGFTGDSWYTAGKPVYWIETTEYNKNKMAFRIRRPFRKYDTWEESLDDWASLIERKYVSAFEAAKRNDFEGFARGLVSGPNKYATDPTYADKLVKLNQDLEGIA